MSLLTQALIFVALMSSEVNNELIDIKLEETLEEAAVDQFSVLRKCKTRADTARSSGSSDLSKIERMAVSLLDAFLKLVSNMLTRSRWRLSKVKNTFADVEYLFTELPAVSAETPLRK